MDNNPINDRELCRQTHSWDNALLPQYPAGQPEIVVKRISLAPGARLSPHSHPVINAGMVIAGNLTVVGPGGLERTFGPGQAIVEMVGTVHYGENRGHTPVDLVMFYASTPGTPLSQP